MVLSDQLGCVRSRRPRGTGLYTVAHNVEEVEGVRPGLRLGRVHLLGSGDGGALALATALRYPRSLRSLVISSGLASIPLTVREMWRWSTACRPASVGRSGHATRAGTSRTHGT